MGVTHQPGGAGEGPDRRRTPVEAGPPEPVGLDQGDLGVELGPLAYQALHVAERIAAGETESDIMRPSDTVATLPILDAIRDAARSQ